MDGFGDFIIGTSGSSQVEGVVKPESLSEKLSGSWSRRIDYSIITIIKDRISGP